MGFPQVTHNPVSSVVHNLPSIPICDAHSTYESIKKGHGEVLELWVESKRNVHSGSLKREVWRLLLEEASIFSLIQLTSLQLRFVNDLELIDRYRVV